MHQPPILNVPYAFIISLWCYSTSAASLLGEHALRDGPCLQAPTCADREPVQCTEVETGPIIVLGNPSVMFEFLEKRSANTSDRTYSPLLPLFACILTPGSGRADLYGAGRALW
ncbi:hypothetical protein BV20DRAFT_667951 [Pilatotrama ljubarskyi]|nr:hypothetical protein BV20DRAFT_667951 [Pilatotrama ljubarskyi]